MIGRRKKRPARERRFETPEVSTHQLLWLVSTVVIAGIPHILHVHPWVPLVVVTIISWRILAAVKRWSLPGNWVRVPLTILGFAGVLFSYRQVSGLSAGSALMLVMCAMKLLETRGHRDRAVVVFICYFLLFAAFLREQAIWSAAYLMTGVLFTTAALFQTARVGDAIAAPRAMAHTSRILLQALPLAAAMFLLFPRIPGPFWALPNAAGDAVTGLANELSPGDISELAISDDVAFRVRFDQAAPASTKLYWRGPVMDQFDGRKWTQKEARGRYGFASRAPRSGEQIDYEVTLEPHNRRWLLSLETPLYWQTPRARLSTAHQLLNDLPVDRRLSYRARSNLSGFVQAGEGTPEIERASQLEDAGNARSFSFAIDLRKRSTDETDYLRNVLEHFSEKEFFYTLRPPSLGQNAIDEFMFESQRGFCGHYASAFAFLARAAGIPARIVTGYQGAEKNPISDYYIVRQSNAHAWVEAWIDGRWIRYDPTAAVAPDRIEFGLGEAMERRNEATGDLLPESALLNRLAMSWDAVNAGWNRWILAYGPENQNSMLQSFGIDNPTADHLIAALIVVVSILLIAIGILQRLQSQPKPDPVESAYRALCKKLANSGRKRRPVEGPIEYAEALSAERPDLASKVTRLIRQYVRLRYEGEADSAARQEFIAAVKSFRLQPFATAPAQARPDPQ